MGFRIIIAEPSRDPLRLAVWTLPGLLYEFLWKRQEATCTLLFPLSKWLYVQLNLRELLSLNVQLNIEKPWRSLQYTSPYLSWARAMSPDRLQILVLAGESSGFPWRRGECWEWVLSEQTLSVFCSTRFSWWAFQSPVAIQCWDGTSEELERAMWIQQRSGPATISMSEKLPWRKLSWSTNEGQPLTPTRALFQIR